MRILQLALDYLRGSLDKPKRRAGAMARSKVVAGLESLEDRRVLSSTGWTPGLINFELERNDTAASATPIAQTSPTRPAADVIYTGGIRRANDIDYYRFVLDRSSTVQIDLYKLNPANSLDKNLDLRLQNSSGRMIRSSTRAGLQSERISRILAAGTYFIRINAADPNVLGPGYQVRLQTTPRPQPPVNPDPNGRTDIKSTALNLGWIGNGQFDVKRTERLGVNGDTSDWYKFTVLWGKESTLRLRYTVTQGTILNLSHRLEDASGNQILLKSNSTSTSTSRDLTLTSSASRLPPGTYYVRFTSPANANLTYNFRVIATPGVWVNPDRNGPNNSLQQVTLLQRSGDGTIPAVMFDRLTPNDKDDFFKVSGPAFKILVTDGDPNDLRIAVFAIYRTGITSAFSDVTEQRIGRTIEVSKKKGDDFSAPNPGLIPLGYIIQVTSLNSIQTIQYRIES